MDALRSTGKLRIRFPHNLGHALGPDIDQLIAPSPAGSFRRAMAVGYLDASEIS